MTEDFKWSVWEDNGDILLGPIKPTTDKHIFEHFESLEDAKEAWKFYKNFFINTFEKKINQL
jgi:hypothetical protein